MLPRRRFGATNLEITTIGFGAWAAGGGDWRFGWGPQDDAQSIAAIHRALERGVNWIDTAAAYGLGHSEEVVAKALDGMHERPYVFTKCGLVASGGGNVTENISPESIRNECVASLRRLRVDAIDLYQIHWPTDDIDEIDAAWQTMLALKSEGKIRHAGVSNFSVEELERARAVGPVETLQPPFSLIKPAAADDVLPYCGAHDIGTIVYSPMGSGLLSGTFSKERAQSLPESDWRSRNADFTEPKLSRNLALVETLRGIGKRHGVSAGEVAIAWTLADPNVSAAIVGGRSAEQVDGVLGAAALQLDPGELAEIKAATP